MCPALAPGELRWLQWCGQVCPKGHSPVIQVITFFRTYFRSVASPCLPHRHADALLERSHLCLLSTSWWGRMLRALAGCRPSQWSCCGAAAKADVACAFIFSQGVWKLPEMILVSNKKNTGEGGHCSRLQPHGGTTQSLHQTPTHPVSKINFFSLICPLGGAKTTPALFWHFLPAVCQAECLHSLGMFKSPL